MTAKTLDELKERLAREGRSTPREISIIIDGQWRRITDFLEINGEMTGVLHLVDPADDPPSERLLISHENYATYKIGFNPDHARFN